MCIRDRFETLSSDTGVLDAVRALRETVPDAFVQVSFAVLPDGYTREGMYCKEMCIRDRSSTWLGSYCFASSFMVSSQNCDEVGRKKPPHGTFHGTACKNITAVPPKLHGNASRAACCPDNVGPARERLPFRLTAPAQKRQHTARPYRIRSRAPAL